MSQHREKVEIGFGSTFTFLVSFTFTFLMNSDFNFRRARLILTLGRWSGRHECHNIGKRLRLGALGGTLWGSWGHFHG